MTREKVMAGLECLTHVDFAVYKSECEKRDCPYRNTDCEIAVMTDAYNLLKAQEQEPVAPIRRQAHAQGADDVWYECGKCGKFLGDNPYSKQVCPKCGKAVKWE